MSTVSHSPVERGFRVRKFRQIGLLVVMTTTLVGLGCQKVAPRPESTEVTPVHHEKVEQRPQVFPLTYLEKRQAWLKIAPIIITYHAKQGDLIWECLERFCKRMDAYQARAGKFASESMSLSTKWEFAKCKLVEQFSTDYMVRFKFGLYMHDLFEQHVISSKDIQREVESCLTDYVERYNALNNEMLVKIQAGLDDAGYSSNPEYSSVASPETFHKAFQTAFDQVIVSVSQGTSLDLVRMTVVQEIGSALAVRLATSIATRLGVSEVILGTGAVSGVATLGISLVGGLALDWLVGELLKEFADYDPERDIREKVVESLEQVKLQLMGRCAAGVSAAFYQHMIDDLYGVPSYPEDEVKAFLKAKKAELEKEYDMGLTYQLVSYQLARSKSIDKALAQFIFGEDVEGSGMGRYWLPMQRPAPQAIYDWAGRQMDALKKGVQP